MKNKFLFLFILLLPLFMQSCLLSPSIKGNGDVQQEERNVDNFNEIKASRGVNVYLSQGEETRVLVRADENLLDVIETEVIGDELIIRSTARVRNAESFKVFVTSPEYESIKSSAGSNVYSETEIVSDNLKVSASSGANITLEINSRDLEVSASSGSNVRLEGLARECSAHASSGANIKAEDLKTKNAELKVSSGANTWISVDNDLKAEASSGGNIFYGGEPSQTSINKSSGGNVKKM
jgi:hypothetical protein